MTGPVVRKWEAVVARRDIDDWVATFRERVLDGMRGVDGFRGVTFLAERGADPSRVTVLTIWRDITAVKGFSGADPGRAVVPDFMVRFFREHDARATFHDQILQET